LIIRLILSTLSYRTPEKRSIEIWQQEAAMCGFTADLIDFEHMTNTQKKTLLKNLHRKRKSLETQLGDVNESLKGIDRCLKVIEKKSKR
jgi:hypothetical protein